MSSRVSFFRTGPEKDISVATSDRLPDGRVDLFGLFRSSSGWSLRFFEGEVPFDEACLCVWRSAIDSCSW